MAPPVNVDVPTDDESYNSDVRIIEGIHSPSNKVSIVNQLKRQNELRKFTLKFHL